MWTSDDTTEEWKYVLLVNMAAASRSVGVDFVELGLTPASGCSVMDLWAGQPLHDAYASLEVTLRPHASLLVRLSDCKILPAPPPRPPTPPPPPLRLVLLLSYRCESSVGRVCWPAKR